MKRRIHKCDHCHKSIWKDRQLVSVITNLTETHSCPYGSVYLSETYNVTLKYHRSCFDRENKQLSVQEGWSVHRHDARHTPVPLVGTSAYGPTPRAFCRPVLEGVDYASIEKRIQVHIDAEGMENEHT